MSGLPALFRPSARTFVIADGGACHDGTGSGQLELIAAAAAAGCDAFKTQWVSDPVRMAQRRGAAERDGYAGIYEKYLAWDPALHAVYAEQCRKHGLRYMCTAFLPEDVETIAPHVAQFKIASFEAGDEEMIRAHDSYEQPLIVSAGMMGVRDVELLQRRIAARFHQGCILHCVSSYPAPLSSARLGLLRLGIYDGFSDHTDPSRTLTGAFAVAAGAGIVEAHLRSWSTDPDNPDAPHAMNPDQFAVYVAHIREAEELVGPELIEAGAQECETSMMRYRVEEESKSAGRR